VSDAIAFGVRGVPQPKGSARAFVVKGHAVVTSDNGNLKDWETAIAWEARAVMAARPDARPLTGAIDVEVVFFRSRPKSRSRTRFPRPVTKPDVDKLARAALDALTGVVFVDDAQVVRLLASKHYDDDVAPGVSVIVKEVAA
jgi:crossover junction endodeoxyribonuclease RusA